VPARRHERERIWFRQASTDRVRVAVAGLVDEVPAAGVPALGALPAAWLAEGELAERFVFPAACRPRLRAEHRPAAPLPKKGRSTLRL